MKSDIKKSCQQHIQVRCPCKYENNHWKCLLLVIGWFRIGHTTFRSFPKMYFRFPRRHLDISGRDVIELYTAINSSRSPWQCLKSAWPHLLQFWSYRGKSGLGGILPPAAGIRVKRVTCWLLSCQVTSVLQIVAAATLVATERSYTLSQTHSDTDRGLVLSKSHYTSRFRPIAAVYYTRRALI